MHWSSKPIPISQICTSCCRDSKNMVRCMVDNYSMLGFWRSWHQSYNLWLIRSALLPTTNFCHCWPSSLERYLYIPLGGSNNTILSMVVIFTFVALWHDLFLKTAYVEMVSSHLHHPWIISHIPPSHHQSMCVIFCLVYWQTKAYVLYAVRLTVVVQTHMCHWRGIQHPYDVICKLGGICHQCIQLYQLYLLVDKILGCLWVWPSPMMMLNCTDWRWVQPLFFLFFYFSPAFLCFPHLFPSCFISPPVLYLLFILFRMGRLAAWQAWLSPCTMSKTQHNNEDAGVFMFPDLSIRTEGSYR